MNKQEAGKLGAAKSRATHVELKKYRVMKYDESPTRCLQCDVSLVYERRKLKFCNSSCAATYNNTGRVKNESTRLKISNSLRKKEAITNLCLNCGSVTKHKKYCSHQCKIEYKTKQNELLVNEGNCSNPRILRKFLLNLHGNKCSLCDTEKWCGVDVPLVLDHIDGDSSNNQLKNLRMICHNCDALLPTFAGRNKGKNKGRKNRRMFYKRKYC